MHLQDHFDVAHLLGHPAFGHLAGAMSAYDQAKRNGLFDSVSYAWPECLSIGGHLQMLRKEELKQCVQAIILFQAMMEKVPYFISGFGAGLKPPSRKEFAQTWEDLLIQIKDPASQVAAKAEFDNYNNSFYKAFRNPIIHGRKADDITKINQIRVTGVYEGMSHGWRAYDYLLTEAFAPQQTHEPSWDNMCAAHGISNTLDLHDYPDLLNLAAQFSKKHLDGARAATG
jgi:hypothetical protein